MIFHQSQQILQDTHKCKLSFVCKNFFTKIVFSQKKFFMLIQSSWGCFLDHLDLPYQFGILIMSTFCWNEIFFTKANWIYAIWINVSPVFFASPLTTNFWKDYKWNQLIVAYAVDDDGRMRDLWASARFLFQTCAR